jgi:hypothetical protein
MIKTNRAKFKFKNEIYENTAETIFLSGQEPPLLAERIFKRADSRISGSVQPRAAFSTKSFLLCRNETNPDR